MAGRYERRDVGDALVVYTVADQGPARRLPTRRGYAEARSAIPTFCVDGLVCTHDRAGVPVVVLLRRGSEGEAAGPFRGEPWVVGGRWDMVTPFEPFVRAKASSELLGGATPAMEVSGPLGQQLFATGWASDGPFGQQGLTVQHCYQVVVEGPAEDLCPLADAEHSEVVVLSGDHPLPALHPYVRDVIELSGWLAR